MFVYSGSNFFLHPCSHCLNFIQNINVVESPPPPIVSLFFLKLFCDTLELLWGTDLAVRGCIFTVNTGVGL